MNLKLATLFTIIISLFNCNSQTSSKIKIINSQEFKKAISTQKVQLVDVRTPSEYKDGTILYAQNIDYENSNFEKNINSLDKSKPVYIFCAKGGRSKSASKILEKAGFVQIYDLEGGYDNWK